VAATSESVLALFRRTDGALVAAVPFAGPGPAAVLTAGDGGAVVVAASESGAMLAVDAATGVLRWSARFPGEVLVAPQADAGVVVASWNDDAGATLRAFDLLDGRARWEARTAALSGAPLVVAGAVVIADGPSPRSGRVRALDVRTGEVRWETPLAGWFDPYLEAAADPSTAYLVDGAGTVVALDLATGAVRWRVETGFDVLHRGVAITASAVVFPTFDDVLVVLDRPTGRPRSADPAPGVPIDLVGTGDRLLVALRLGAPSRVEARTGP
jgi:outer membrane protein assembly factor BamB